MFASQLLSCLCHARHPRPRVWLKRRGAAGERLPKLLAAAWPSA